jgi:hypothetical protein
VFARGPAIDSLLAQELKPLSNKFFSEVGLNDIPFGVFNDLQDGFKLGLKLRVVLQVVKKVLRA